MSSREFRQNWARLIQKVYEVDPLLCTKCTGTMKIISFIEDLDIIEKILKAGHIGVTSECGPPRGSDAEEVKEKGMLIKDYVDAVNVTDNQTAMTRMSSLAACIHLKQLGIEPVLQMVTRDRNRVALQSDILGAASFDIPNMLCLSGDHQSFGDFAAGQNVHDLDSMQLVQTVRHMRDEGKFLGGDDIHRPLKV